MHPHGRGVLSSLQSGTIGMCIAALVQNSCSSARVPFSFWRCSLLSSRYSASVSTYCIALSFLQLARRRTRRPTHHSSGRAKSPAAEFKRWASIEPFRRDPHPLAGVVEYAQDRDTVGFSSDGIGPILCDFSRKVTVWSHNHFNSP